VGRQVAAGDALGGVPEEHVAVGQSISAGVSVHGDAFRPCSSTSGRCQFSRPPKRDCSFSCSRRTVGSLSVWSVWSTTPGRWPAWNA
jgi:hypothetical protein